MMEDFPANASSGARKIARPSKRFVATGSLICQRDRNHLRRDRTQYQRIVSYSTSGNGRYSEGRAYFFALAGITGLLATFVIWIQSGKNETEEEGKKSDKEKKDEPVLAMQSSSISDKEKKEEPILAMESSSISDKEKKEEPVFAMESSSVSDKTKEEEPVFAMESSSDKGKGEEPVLPKGFPDHCPYLLIGAGLASLNAFKAIKTHDPKAKVLMIGEENHPPYNRPPLSKQLWYEEDPENVKDFSFIGFRGKRQSVFLSEGLYMEPSQVAEHENGGLAHMPGTKVVSLNPTEKKVVLDNGKEITFDKCLIATGGKPILQSVFENASDSVKRKTTVFRSLNDLMDLYQITDTAKSIAVIGDGFLGSELATAMAFKGKKTNMKVYQVIQQNGHLPKILSPLLGTWVTARVEEEGVYVFPRNRVVLATEENDKVKLVLKNNITLKVDHVVVAVGLTPNVDLAESSGLPLDKVNGGFITDPQMKVCDSIWAAGDVASFEDPMFGRRRVEHYDHASITGSLAGRNMAGVPSSYSFQSMFWADLGKSIAINAVGVVDAKLNHQMFFGTETGITGPNWKCRAVVLYQRENRVVGLLTFNLDDADHMTLAREVIKDGCVGQSLPAVADLFLKKAEREKVEVRQEKKKEEVVKMEE